MFTVRCGVKSQELGKIVWLVPYKTGELSVTANTNDQEVRYTLETTKEPVTILLHPIEEKRDMDQAFL